MTTKILTFNKITGESEIACIESKSEFPVKDAIKRLVSDISVEKINDEICLNENHHLYVYESEYWKIIVSI